MWLEKQTPFQTKYFEEFRLAVIQREERLYNSNWILSFFVTQYNIALLANCFVQRAGDLNWKTTYRHSHNSIPVLSSVAILIIIIVQRWC